MFTLYIPDIWTTQKLFQNGLGNFLRDILLYSKQQSILPKLLNPDQKQNDSYELFFIYQSVKPTIIVFFKPRFYFHRLAMSLANIACQRPSFKCDKGFSKVYK